MRPPSALPWRYLGATLAYPASFGVVPLPPSLRCPVLLAWDMTGGSYDRRVII
jgi:hypothetical protein